MQNFDLVLEMDKVLEFISPHILKRNGLKDHKKHYALDDSNTKHKLGYQLADEGRKATEEEEHAQDKPEIMVDAQVILFRRTHVEKEGVVESGV